MYKPDYSKNATVVLGSCPTGLGTVRSLGRHRVPVWVVDPSKVAPANYSRYSKVLTIADPNTEAERLLETLLKFSQSQELKPVLIGSRDDYIVFMGQNYETLKEHFYLDKINQETIDIYLNKRNFYRICREFNILIPQTIFLDDEIDPVGFSENLSFPGILKPMRRHRWDQIFKGKKVFRFESREEFIDGYKKIKQYDLHKDIVIQEIITGPDSNIFVFAGYFDRDSKPLVAHTARRMRQYPPKFGTGTMFKPELNQRMLDTMVPMLQKLGYHGIVGGEMKEDPKDGTIKMLEVNARMSRWTGVVETSGVNLPYTAYCDHLGLPKPPPEYHKEGWTLIHAFRDCLSSIYYIRTKEITIRQWIDSWKGKRYYCVYSPDDPKPFWAGIFTIFYYGKNYIKKKLR